MDRGTTCGNIQPSQHSCTLPCNSCYYAFYLELKPVQLNPSLLLSYYLLWYISWDFLGLILARLENASQVFTSTCLWQKQPYQNSLICWTEDHHQVQHYSVWQKLITVRAVHCYRIISKLNQQYQKSKWRILLFVTTMEETRNLCLVVRIDPLLSCVLHLYQHQQHHWLTTTSLWSWV